MEFDGDLDSKAREIEDLKKSEDELTQQAAMRWADSQLDPHIPQPPFFLQLVGGIGKGKTTIILNLVREYQRVNTFARVIYLSPSGLNDPKLRMFLTADNSNMEYTEENLTELMQEIEEETAAASAARPGGSDTATPASGSQGLSPAEVKQRIQRKVPPTLGAKEGINQTGLAGTKDKIKTKEELAKEARKRVSNRTLIIADDATGSILTKRNSPFVQFLVSIRHQNASVILCTHSNSSLAAQIRNITTAQILFEPGTGTELKSLVQDIGGVSDKTLESMLSHVAQIPHGFVMVDKKRPFRDRFILNFRQLLDPHAFRSAKEGGAEGEEMFRSGGYLPTPAQATAAERKFTEKGIFLQQEAIRLNTGLTPAEKILQEQNLAAKRARQVQSGAKTEKFKRDQARTAIKQKGKKQTLHDRTVTATGAIRSAMYQQNSAARLTSTSQPGGVLDAKFQRGVARNNAIATGGRRGIGGRGRRGASALGPLAQQLAENLEAQAELKRQKDALGRDQEARTAEAAAAEKAAQERIPVAPPLPGNPKHLFQLALKQAKAGLNSVEAENRAQLAKNQQDIADKEAAEILPDVEPETGVFSPQKLAADQKQAEAKAKAQADELAKDEKRREAEVVPMAEVSDIREDDVPDLPPPPPPLSDSPPSPVAMSFDELAKTNVESTSGPQFGKDPFRQQSDSLNPFRTETPSVETPGVKPKPGRKALTALEKEDFTSRQSAGKNIAARKQLVNMNRASALSAPSTDVNLGGAPASETNVPVANVEPPPAPYPPASGKLAKKKKKKSKGDKKSERRSKLAEVLPTPTETPGDVQRSLKRAVSQSIPFDAEDVVPLNSKDKNF